METEKLIGISAGKICFTNFNENGYYLQKLLEEAQVVWESGRSAWTLLSQDVSGNSRWLSPDENQVAMVLNNTEIHIQDIS